MEIIYFDTLTSTNVYLLDVSKKDAKPWTVIFCKNQTAGKGYAGNKWQDEEGLNLTFSFLLKLPIDFSDLIYVNEWVANGVRNTLSNYLPNCYVKWPNDILANDKKICGILIENYKSGDFMNCIIGIGVNVNQTDFESLPKASSLRAINGIWYDLQSLLSAMLSEFQNSYDQLENRKYLEIHQNYLSHLYKYNQIGLYQKDGVKFHGIIRDVSSNGNLVLELENDEMQSFRHKEIEMIY